LTQKGYSPWTIKL